MAEIIPAVVGLENAGQWHAANQGDNMILNHWPVSLAALIGIGYSTLFEVGKVFA